MLSLLNRKKNEDKKNINSNDNILDNDIFKNGTKGLYDLYKPECIVEDYDHLYFGPQKYARMYGIEVFPRNVSVGFLNGFFRAGSIDISTYIEPIADNEIMNKLNSKYSKIQSNLNIKLKNGEIIDYAQKEAADDLDEMRELIQTNKEKMFYTQTLITVWGTSLEELNTKGDYLEDICSRMTIKPRVLVLEQLDAFLSTITNSDIRYKECFRNMTIGGVASLIPLGNTELTHRNGIYLGRNLYTGSLIFYNNYIKPPEVMNPHMFVCGMPGAGKSVTLKLISSRSAANGRWVFILDPEEEYKIMMEKLGGQYITLKPGVKSGINPFELEIELDEKGQKKVDLYSKKSEIRSLISLFVKKFRNAPLEAEEIVTLEDTLTKLYTFKRNITNDPESLYEERQYEKDGKFYTGKVKKSLPTLSELREELSKIKATEKLAQLMSMITGDGSMAMFDCETSININNRLVAINLKHLNDEFTKFFATVNILSWLWGILGNWKYKDIEKATVVDEGWLFARFKESVEFLEEIARRGRKYNLALIIASQMIQEFLGSESGKAVIHQCATKIIMRQDASIADEVANFFKVSDGCKSMISTFRSGQALLMSDKYNVLIGIEPYSFEWDFVKT